MKKIISFVIFIVLLINIMFPALVFAIDNGENENILANESEKIDEDLNNENDSSLLEEDEKIITDDTINENKQNIENTEEIIQKNEIVEKNNNIISNTNSNVGDILPLEENETPMSVNYKTHIQNEGWQDWKKDGEMVGTEGKALRLEAIKIKLVNPLDNINIKYQVHIQNIGWQDWKKDGEMAGTEGKALRLEAIKIKLEETSNYSIMYRVHIQDIGWQEWKYDGELAGTEGQSKRIEAIQIKILDGKYEKFCVSAVNGNNKINEFIKNDIHYMFITKDMDITNLALNYTGNIESTTYGNIDKENKQIIGDFSNTEDLKVILNSGEVKKIKVIQSDVSALKITLKNGQTLENINKESKDTKYSASLNVVGADDSKYDIIDNDIEIKGRGNSTWYAQKKPYQIKLSKKNNLLGIGKGKAKKWVLIANYSDPTLLKNKIQNDLCTKSGLANIPNSTFIDLYVNDNYVGNYLLCDKIEVGTGRVELNDEHGVLAELDNEYFEGEDYYFKAAYSENMYTIKEFANDELDENTKKMAMNEFKKALDTFEKVIYSGNTKWSDIEKLIDVESFAKYYLITEFAENPDSYYSSTFFYKDGVNDVIHMGPTWDYDCAFGFYQTVERGKDPYVDFTLNYTFDNNYMRKLFEYPQFVKKVNEVYEDILKEYINNIDIRNYANEIKNSSRINSIVWYLDGKYEDRLNRLNNWVNHRINYFNQTYKKGNLNANILYSAHVQGIGITKIKKDGEVSGTENQGLRMEGIRINIGNQLEQDVTVKYQAHVEEIGWQNWKMNGQLAGTEGQSKRMEAIRICLENAEAYSIMYRVHIQDIGWQDWKCNGEIAGTEGLAKRIEAIQIKIIKNKVSYKSHIEDIGWQKSVQDGNVSGTQAQNKRMEAIGIKLINNDSNIDIKYQTHIQDIGWQDWKYNGEIAGTEGQGKRLEAIRIKLSDNTKYSVRYRVHVQNIGWQDWKSDGEMAGTEGQSLRLEAIQIQIIEK